MPYSIRKNVSSCGASKPWAVVKIADGKVVGCHESRESAIKQLAALHVAEKKES